MTLLFFSFRLILATTHPRMHDSVRTNTEIRRTDMNEPITDPTVAETFIR